MMRRANPCLLVAALLVAALLVAAGARAQNASANASATTSASARPATASEASLAADAPYAGIVARNMFGLVPIPPPDPDAGKPPVEPPPKITLNGIMTIFGKDQALFKVANKPKPGQPQKDDAYVLAEGEMQDEITVKKIDHVAGLVSFDNHGTPQDLTMSPVKEGSAGGGAGGAPGSPGGPLGRPLTAVPQLGAAMRTFPGGIPIPAIPNRGVVGSPGSTMGMGGGAVGSQGMSFGGGGGARANQSDTEQLTPEQHVLLIEAQRMKYLQAGDKETANMFPPTPLTQQVIQENSGTQQ